MRVCDCEGIFVDGIVYGAPDVDYLVAGFEEEVGFGGEVVQDAVSGGRVGLVYVNSFYGGSQR